MITVKNIIQEGHPLLRTVATEVSDPISLEDVQLMRDMLQYVINSQDEKLAKKYNLKSGVGLAAVQIGVNKRIVAVHTEDEKGETHSYVLANPRIVSHSEQLTYLPDGEGCLSVSRHVRGIVPRYRRMTVQGLDIDGNTITVRAKDYIAIIFQHEVDHLNGIMFFDHINQESPCAPIPGAHEVRFD